MRALVALSAALIALASPSAAGADWTLGYEGTDDWSHAFLTLTQPVGSFGDTELLAWGTASWVRYDILDGATRREVSAPGVGAGLLARWAGRRGAIQLGPGYEVRWVDRGFGNETESGLLLRADGHYWVSDEVVFTGGATYYDVIEWYTTRSSMEYELFDGFRLGPEVGYQGNDDINIREIGGIARYPISDSAAAFVRAGTARTEYSNGRTTDDPYFNFGIGYTIRR